MLINFFLIFASLGYICKLDVENDFRSSDRLKLKLE